MNGWNRYIAVSGQLMATTAPASALLGRSYGRREARRFGVGMAGTLAVQQALVGFELRRRAWKHDGSQARGLTVVDLLTLSRGAAAATLVGLMVSRIRDRPGVAGWFGWTALVNGAILCDWLDGPLARRYGTSGSGALFDLEADSWLTLCTAGAAVAWGDLPVTVAIAPVLRYALMFSAMRGTPYADLYREEPGWARPIGMGQMLLFIAALAPFRGRATWVVVRFASVLEPPLQVGALLLLQRRRGQDS